MSQCISFAELVLLLFFLIDFHCHVHIAYHVSYPPQVDRQQRPIAPLHPWSVLPIPCVYFQATFFSPPLSQVCERLFAVIDDDGSGELTVEEILGAGEKPAVTAYVRDSNQPTLAHLLRHGRSRERRMLTLHCLVFFLWASLLLVEAHACHMCLFLQPPMSSLTDLHLRLRLHYPWPLLPRTESGSKAALLQVDGIKKAFMTAVDGDGDGAVDKVCINRSLSIHIFLPSKQSKVVRVKPDFSFLSLMSSFPEHPPYQAEWNRFIQSLRQQRIVYLKQFMLIKRHW